MAADGETYRTTTTPAAALSERAAADGWMGRRLW
jgi:hypothetical protein